MANKYNNALAVLLNNGGDQVLPVSKAQLIELANSQKGQFGDAQDVAAALTYLLNKTNTDLETAKTYVGTEISNLTSTQTVENGYVMTGITETGGMLTGYTQTKLDAANISYNGNSNVESALTDLYSQIGEGGSVTTQIQSAIAALTNSEVAEDGKPIVSISQTDGLVTAEAGNISSSYVDVDNTSNKFNIDGENVPTTLSTQSVLEQLQSEIDGLGDNAKEYQLAEITSGLPTNVRERKQLQVKTGSNNSWTNVQNSYVDVYKDSALLAAQITKSGATWDSTNNQIEAGSGTDDVLALVYEDKNGTVQLVEINVSDFLREAEAGTGLSVTNGVLNVVKDANSENFLEVNSDSIAVVGVQDAIYTAVNSYVNKLDSEIETKTEGNITYALTGLVEVDGVLTNASYIALTDKNIKTELESTDALKVLAGENGDVSDVNKALNLLANNINVISGGTLGNIEITEGTYIGVSNASKNGTTYSFTIDDSALGNVARLHFDTLSSNAETVSILGSNPEIQG